MAKITLKAKTIPRWIRFLLFFKRSKVWGWDCESGKLTMVYAKRLRGRLYILKVRQYIPPPQNYPCEEQKAEIDPKLLKIINAENTAKEKVE